MEADRVTALTRIFDDALDCVVRRGYGDEVCWARETTLAALTERKFLSELAWCVLNAGMRESVVRAKWPAISAAFFDFASSEAICATTESCVRLARRSFNHPAKMRAIVDGASRIRASGGFARFQRELSLRPLELLAEFSFIGPVTVFHLARNIGIDCAKPDRHLTRFAAAWGYEDVAALCADVASAVEERIGVVDVVLWRHLALDCRCCAHAA